MTLILRSHSNFERLLIPGCLLIICLATGCITMKEKTYIDTVISTDPESATGLIEPPGYRRVIKMDSSVSEKITAEQTQVPVTMPTDKNVAARSEFKLLLPLPEKTHATAHHQFQQDMYPESALIKIQGDLQEDPLSELGEEYRCVNSSLEEEFCAATPSFWSRIKEDHAHYYSKESLLWLAGGFGVGAIIANSSLDGGIQNHLQSSLLGASSDDWLETFHAQKELGNGRDTLPLFAAAWGASLLFENVPLINATGEWGERSIRAIIVGTPPMLAMQYVTGASRPGETSANAKWKPFQDNNGVSGHSFMGAIPFLAAAKVTERPLLKVLYYAGSTLAPLSRLNDNHHYPSQAFLGWYMAWVATNAVDATQHADQNWRMFPISWSGVTGVGIEYNW